jgi:3-oxoacyl-[acyl-carrier protein] reductase
MGLRASARPGRPADGARATLLLVQGLAARFDAGGGGRVVVFTSGQHHGVLPGELPHIASKAALRELAAHLAGRGITVNCVNRGPNDTGHGDSAGTPQDAARLVGWLVSEEAAWVTEQVIASDGGWSTLGA